MPAFLDAYPTAVINYRWPETLPDETIGVGDGKQQPLHWPTPIHDTLFGYGWITKNLAPPERQRRDIYVCGSYLGASLGAALTLTEAHPDERMAVRGLAAYNGIYNWTTFLPDHPINKASEWRLGDLAMPKLEGSTFHYLKQQIPILFKSPSNLFDPFASACLFFHTAGLLAPSDFAYGTLPSSLLQAIETLSQGPTSHESAALEATVKAPRKGYLAFPPRRSSLKIPKSLLVHEAPPPSRPAGRRKRTSGSAKVRAGENNFATQANELAGLMRRSINKLELKERMKSDEDIEDFKHEAEQRVQVTDAGIPDAGFDMSDRGQEIIHAWLQERLGEH